MSKYEMNQYNLQSYFKSLCNSFYIAYEQVKRLEKEQESLEKESPKKDLETAKGLLKIGDEILTPNKYVILKHSREQLLKEKEKLEEMISFWSDNMWADYEAIKCALYTIKDNNFYIIVTTKEEIYALMRFYYEHTVEDYPVVNMEKEYREAFPTGEEVYEDFLKAYDFDYWADAKGVEDGAMKELYEKYF